MHCVSRPDSFGFCSLPAAFAAEPRPRMCCGSAPTTMRRMSAGAYGNTTRADAEHRLAWPPEGMRFDRAYLQFARLHRLAAVVSDGPLSADDRRHAARDARCPKAKSRWPRLLQAAGYDTAAIGKMHFNSTLKHGFDLRVDLRRTSAAGCKRRARRRSRPASRRSRRGSRSGTRPRSGSTATAQPFACGRCRHGGDVVRRAGGAVPDRSRQVAKRASRTQPPFFLMVSFYEPHSPFHFPVEYRGRHTPDEFTVPAGRPRRRLADPRDLSRADRRRETGHRRRVLHVGRVSRQERGARARRARSARARPTTRSSSTPATTATCSASTAASKSTAPSNRRSVRR